MTSKTFLNYRTAASDLNKIEAIGMVFFSSLSLMAFGKSLHGKALKQGQIRD